MNGIMALSDTVTASYKTAVIQVPHMNTLQHTHTHHRERRFSSPTTCHVHMYLVSHIQQSIPATSRHSERHDGMVFLNPERGKKREGGTETRTRYDLLTDCHMTCLGSCICEFCSECLQHTLSEEMSGLLEHSLESPPN